MKTKHTQTKLNLTIEKLAINDVLPLKVIDAELGFCKTCGLNRIKVVKTTTHDKKLDLPYLMMQTLYHTCDSLTSD